MLHLLLLHLQEGAGEALLIGEGKGKWDWETEEPAMHLAILKVRKTQDSFFLIIKCY